MGVEIVQERLQRLGFLATDIRYDCLVNSFAHTDHFNVLVILTEAERDRIAVCVYDLKLMRVHVNPLWLRRVYHNQ